MSMVDVLRARALIWQTELAMPGLNPCNTSRLQVPSTKKSRSEVLELCFPTYGHMENMANAVAKGARSTGAMIDVER
ncbi:hypothetical protein SAMN06265795_10382 [Noviherbaspirillum humi]|uniref:Uncharacterized protein n=1 Tax=Noviherbaspirillum humi TaxID=1688639 RepID=A0A239F055_9BURK|nr:hypothetical protein SAMN06265795_10382 [Noviherbaspirillum humi]